MKRRRKGYRVIEIRNGKVVYTYYDGGLASCVSAQQLARLANRRFQYANGDRKRISRFKAVKI